MSQFNLRYVPTLSCNELILNGQRFSTQGAVISGVPTTALTTEVIINDQTKNQALYEEIVGNIHGNTFPQLQAEIDAIDANVAILQGQVIQLQATDASLQSQINVLSGNVVIDEAAIAELIRDTQFLEAPYNGFAGNTSLFWRGLQVYNTPTDVVDETNGTGIFSYLDDAGNVSNQIQLRVQDTKNVLISGGSQFLKPKSTGNVNIKNTDGNFQFLVGDRTAANFQFNSQTEINGDIRLKGQDNNKIEIYTQPGSVVPPAPAIKRVDIRGDQELRLFGAYTAINEDGGASVVGQNGNFQMTGSNGGYFNTGGNSPSIFAPGGSSPGSIDLQIGSCDLNTTGKINIGTSQGLTELGFKEIYIGQNGPPTAARKSSTLLDGDTYLPQNLVTSPNLGGWDNIVYLGLPTAYSGPLRGPVKNTYTPYVRSISTFSAAPTINSFISSSGTFSVAVGLGAITLNAGAGGCLINCAAGLCSLTSLVGGIGLTTAGGAIALTTGAGIIQMTTGAAPIAMETNIGDILLKAGYSNQSTPQLSLGSVYIQARDYNYITPDKGVIIGEGIVVPFTEVLLDTMGYTFTGNLFSNIGTPSNLWGVYSNAFVTPGSQTTLLNPVTSNLVYFNDLDEVGQAQSVLLNMDINPASIIALSQLATVPAGNVTGNLINTTTSFYFPDNTILPLNANLSLFAYPTIDNAPSNIGRYKYSTWQSNIQIQSNISGFVNSYVEPNPPSYENYMTVLGNVGILADCDVGANITVASSSFPLQQTLITRNSVTTTGNMTCNTLNYTTLNPPIYIGVEQILAGTNVTISPVGGQGIVTINANVSGGGGGGVDSIIAGNGIQISPIGGQGNVIVSLAGSVIPPGGYLPINGGTMNGSIYQTPSTSGTIKKYRPLTSYQPPFPSISIPSFTGEQLTFFNGDNSPEQVNFTGWFPENMFQYQPDVITKAIVGTSSNFYSSSGGTNLSAVDIPTGIGNFTVGQRINGGNMNVNASSPGYRGVLFNIYTAPPNVGDREQWVLLFQTSLKNFPTSAASYSLSDIDYTYDGSIAQLGQNWMVVFTDNDGSGNEFISLNTVNTLIGDINTYAWDGNIANAVSPTEYFVGVQGDSTTSILYEYFPGSNTTNKIGAVNLTNGQLAKINGIYYDDILVTRQIIVYGNFNTLTIGSTVTTCNHIFIYNIDTGAVNVITTSTADPVYATTKPVGMNGQVWGVEKQSSLVFSRRTWIWGDFTGVNQMGFPTYPNDVALANSSIGYTFSDNWAFSLQWGAQLASTKLGGCRGGKIVVDDPNSQQSFALMVWATTRNFTNFKTVSIVYYDIGTQSSTAYPFGNGNFGNPALTTNIITRMDMVGQRTGPSTVIDQLVFCGSYIGLAYGAGNVDVTCYSLSSTQITNNNWNPANNPPWPNALRLLGDSGDASFWYPNNDLIGSTTYYVAENGTVNEIAVIGTTGYASTTTNGGGVMTMANSDFVVPAPTVNKFFIEGVQAYSVNNIIFNSASTVQLTCSLDEDNFWYGQTFDFTINPPGPPTTPTVIAINGAKFVVNNHEMDKIVFSGGDTDFSSVSFIAGSVEKGDKYWYWQAQVGAIDYFAGNVFYPNITASGNIGGGGIVYTAGQNITITGNVISLSDPLTSNLDLASVAITGNGFNNEINMVLDFTGLSVLNTVSNDNIQIDELGVTLTDFTNFRVSQYDAFTGIAFEDMSGNMVSNFRSEDLTFSDTVLNNLTSLTSTALTFQSNINQFSITKSGADTNMNQSSGSINIQTSNILAITSQNAVEIGTPSRREELVAVEVLNTGTLSTTAVFDSVSGIINTSSWTNTTVNTTITDVTVAGLYDDGNNGNQIMAIALIQDDGGVETVLASLNADLSSTLGTFTVTFSTVLNPSPTKFYFIRLSVPPASPMYAYYGTISDGITPFCTVLGLELQEVSDPVEYFNVYGNSFYQDEMLIHANVTVADPSNNFFKSIIEYNQIQLLGENFNTQLAPGSTYITSGTNQQVQQATSLQIKRTDIIQQATLSQTQLLFQQNSSQRTASYNNAQCVLDKTSGPISRATLSPGILELNNNATGGSTINFNKDAISVATDVISTINSSTRDVNNTSRIFTRLQSRTSAVGTNNQDGTLAVSVLINGTLTEVFNFQGGENEINSFRTLDMNGQAIKTASGNLIISSTTSTGVGVITLTSKPITGTITLEGGGVTGNASIVLNTTDLNFNNTTTQATVANHTSSLGTNSNIPEITTYLKVKLDGNFIWIPYFTQDPSV